MRATEEPKWIQIGSESYELGHQYEILINTANWLINKGHLKPSDCPIKVSSQAKKNYLINSTPTHSTGKKFSRKKRLKNGLYIESHSNRAERYAKRLLEKYGYDPAILQIKY